MIYKYFVNTDKHYLWEKYYLFEFHILLNFALNLNNQKHFVCSFAQKYTFFIHYSSQLQITVLTNTRRN